MAFKAFKIDHTKRSKLVDPIDIFDSLTLRGSVNNLWTPQSKALSLWHQVRNKPDISIEMNTGGGKTLVGLLISLSLARELDRMVLFVSPTIQLIQQTAEKARECSIEVATYYDGDFVKEEVATSASGPCLTTHAALFNGKSIFHRHELGAIVLDDAHAAGGIIRDCFTLKIPRATSVYKEIAELFRPYFKRSSMDSVFDEVLAGANRDLLFVPLFESSKQAGVIQEKLLEAGVNQEKEFKFAWSHLKDRLDRCVFLINNNGLEIAPACLPTEQTPLFQKGIRRVYLTATLPSPIEFHRTFGVVPHAVKPTGRSGEAQRVFLAADGETDDEQRDDAKSLLRNHKALILTPSTPAAGEWADCASLFTKNDDNERIEEFKAAKPPDKLVLAARYDGVDLPGDACRILILDGLPRGEALLSTYINESLRIETVRAATTAIRVVQAVGRIFRSNTDHGAVVLVGSSIQRWLTSPFNRAFLPPLLQQQLDLACEIGEKIDAGEFTAADVLKDLLEGGKEWDAFYSDNIGKIATKQPKSPPEWLTSAIQNERAAHHAMWNADYPKSAALYAKVAHSTEEYDPDLAAWNRHFEGYCFERAGRVELAEVAYLTAAGQRASLGRPKLTSRASKPTVHAGTGGRQAANIARLASHNGAQWLTRAQSLPNELVLGSSSGQIEKAIHDLGKLLGLEATRPDREFGTGPDILWLAPDAPVGHAFEAKTDKRATSQYNKSEVGQAHDHRQWLKNTHANKEIGLSWVGRTLPVSHDSSPDDSLTVLELGALTQLANRVQQLFEALTVEAVDADTVHAWLTHYALSFPECVNSLPNRRAVDLKVGDDE